MLMNRLICVLTVAIAICGLACADAAEYSGIAMTDVSIKNQGEIATVAPGETFGVHATYEFLWPRETHSIVQIIVGYDGIGAQTSIANGIVFPNGRYYDHHPLFFRHQKHDITKKSVDFALVAPQEPGVYEIRFRYAQAYLPHEAVAHWWNVDQAPTAEATIGRIIVE